MGDVRIANEYLPGVSHALNQYFGQQKFRSFRPLSDLKRFHGIAFVSFHENAAMEELDGDTVRLSSRGRYAERDIVQVRYFSTECMLY